jgi:hypothetical protein
MAEGAIDFRSGQPFGQTVFFDEYVDIHHIFPQDWCKKQKIEPRVFDTVINKTPLSYKTNRILGGVAPSVYLARLEAGGKDAPPIRPRRWTNTSPATRWTRHFCAPTISRASWRIAKPTSCDDRARDRPSDSSRAGGTRGRRGRAAGR